MEVRTPSVSEELYYAFSEAFLSSSCFFLEKKKSWVLRALFAPDFSLRLLDSSSNWSYSCSYSSSKLLYVVFVMAAAVVGAVVEELSLCRSPTSEGELRTIY